MNTELTVQAVAAFNAGKIEQSGLLFWRAAHLAPSYCSLHNYAVYLSDNALYIPIGGGKYAAIKKQPAILYYLKRAQRLATIPHWKNEAALGNACYLQRRPNEALAYFEQAMLHGYK